MGFAMRFWEGRGNSGVALCLPGGCCEDDVHVHVRMRALQCCRRTRATERRGS